MESNIAGFVFERRLPFVMEEGDLRLTSVLRG